MTQSKVLLLATIVLVVVSSGCEDDDERLARLAQTSNQQQAEQNVAMAENTRAVAEGSIALIEAENQSRQELVALQRDLRSDQAELSRQRESLDRERRSQAAAERRDSLLAPVIVTLGLLLACIAPLIIAGFSLLGLYMEPTREEGEALLTELWLELQEPARAATEASSRLEQDEDPLLPLLAEAER
jgi:hypothetical protein